MSELTDWRRGLTNDAVQKLQEGLKAPRGIRNANPLNIVASSRYLWRGQCGVDDAGKLIFLEPRYGIRAAAINMTSYHELHGVNTIGQLIDRWSGDEIAIKESYTDYVCKVIVMKHDEPVDLDVQGRQIIQAMIGFECGVVWDGRPLRQWYDYAYLRDAVSSSHLR